MAIFLFRRGTFLYLALTWVMLSGKARADQSQDIAEMKAMMLQMQKTIVQLQGEVTTLKEQQRQQQSQTPKTAPSPLAALKKAVLPAKPHDASAAPGDPQTPALPPPAPSLSQRPLVFDDMQAGPLPANEWSEPRYAGLQEISDSGWWIHVGGTLKTDVIFVSNEENDTFYNGLTLAQSRIHVDLRSNSDLGPVRLYYETNFSWNVRHLYAQIGGLTFGQTWSAFYDPSAAPDVLYYPSALLQGYNLRSQIRYTFPSDNEHFRLTMAIETSGTENVYGNSYPSGGTLSGRVPNFLLQARWEHEKWHLQAAGVLRDLHYSTFDNDDEDTVGYGLSITGAYHLGRRDHLMAGIAGGNGANPYFSTVAYNSASVNTSNELDLNEAWSAFLGYQHLWNDRWRSQIAWRHEGGEWSQPYSWSQGLTNRDVFQANLIWTVSDQLSAGIEYQGTLMDQFNARDEYDHLLMFSLMYRFF